MASCIPKKNCAHRLLGTVCSEKVRAGGGGARGARGVRCSKTLHSRELAGNLNDVGFRHPLPENPLENACQPINGPTRCNIPFSSIQAAGDYFSATITIH